MVHLTAISVVGATAARWLRLSTLADSVSCGMPTALRFICFPMMNSTDTLCIGSEDTAPEV